MEYLYKGKTIKIEQDDNPESPRDWDNIGIMVCFHGRYELGDKNTGYSKKDYDSWDELEAQIKKEGAIVILPIGLYDHSGRTMYIGSSHDQWDGGQVGFIYTTKEQLNKMGTKASKKKIEEYLRNEVKVYDQYLTGDVYGYDTGEDSCWGFYGEDEAKKEAESAVDYQIEQEQKEHEAKLKAQIIHNVPLAYR
ncbi:MAG: hypothetical protein AAB922_02370 [Patescibacteria group bacterium]